MKGLHSCPHLPLAAPLAVAVTTARSMGPLGSSKKHLHVTFGLLEQAIRSIRHHRDVLWYWEVQCVWLRVGPPSSCIERPRPWLTSREGPTVIDTLSAFP